jgi:hypothetical protein
MCFFICLAVDKKHVQDPNVIPRVFEAIDATDWSIGEATCGNRDRDRSFLITSGGCSCFIGANHQSEQSTLNEFESLIRSLLKQAPHVSILIHYASGDISQERVMKNDKRSIRFNELSGQLHKLELDVRYILNN